MFFFLKNMVTKRGGIYVVQLPNVEFHHVFFSKKYIVTTLSPHASIVLRASNS
jgi:hypothetical protein